MRILMVLMMMTMMNHYDPAVTDDVDDDDDDFRASRDASFKLRVATASEAGSIRIYDFERISQNMGHCNVLGGGVGEVNALVAYESAQR
jgi:hypothetical protein